MDDLYPSKLHRVNNMRHKKFALKKYTKISEQFDYNEKDQTFDNFNFKKTTANKKRFSCGGYGGTCAMCKRGAYSDGKRKRKQTIIYGNKTFNLCLPFETAFWFVSNYFHPILNLKL